MTLCLLMKGFIGKEMVFSNVSKIKKEEQSSSVQQFKKAKTVKVEEQWIDGA